MKTLAAECRELSALQCQRLLIMQLPSTISPAPATASGLPQPRRYIARLEPHPKSDESIPMHRTEPMPGHRPCAIFVTDCLGNLLDLDAMAKQVIRDGMVLCVRSGVLTTTDPEHRSRWSTWLRNCDDLTGSDRLLLRRHLDQRLVTVRRVQDGAHTGLGGANLNRKALEVSDPHLCGPSCHQRAVAAQQLFGWTRRDAEVVEHLLMGCSAAEAAQRMGVSLGNVRQRLKTIFSKADVNGQMQLVARLADIV